MKSQLTNSFAQANTNENKAIPYDLKKNNKYLHMKTNSLFNKFFLVMALAIFSVAKAQTVNTEWATKINQTFAGIDKNKVPHSLLRDYAMEFTNLAAYNGVLTDTSYVSKGTLTSIYNTLLMARVKTNVTGLVSPNSFKQNWKNLRQKNTIVLSGLYYKYSQFKANAHPNFVTVSNNIFYDKYVSGIWQTPYEEKQVFAITPPIVKYKGLKTNVKLPQTLWYSNQNTVQSIAIDFDNGAGYTTIPFNGTYNLQYAQEGVKNWKYKLTLTNGQVLYSQSRIIFEGTLYDVSNVPLQRTINQPCSQNESGIDQVEFVGTQLYLGAKNTATLEIDYASNDCKIKKPLIVAEGFESGLLGVENGLGDNDYKDFLAEATYLTGNLEDEIANYDIIYVNWDNGKDHLQRNALLLEDIIQWVNQQKAINNSPEKNVVLGQSMGGVIARYALSDMEQRNLVHDTKLYISHDAPHQGANIPIGIQYFARHLADQFIGTPMGDFQFEVSDGSEASIQDINGLLNSTATKQLLDNYITSGFNLDNSVNNTWQADLLSKGYPTQTRNIAISNGSHCAKTQDYDYNASLFRMSGYAKTGILSDILGSLLGIADDIALAVAFNEPALLIGVLPGNSKFNLDFDAKALPIANQNANIYKGKVSFTKKLLWVANITVTLTDRSYNNPVNLSYDKYAGGKYQMFGQIANIEFFDDNGFEIIEDHPITQFHADLLNLLASANISFGVENTFGFISVPSALDVGSGVTNLNNEDYLRSYTAANPPTGNISIPFHNFMTGFQNNNSLNERHISFNTKNGNWLASELDNNANNNDIFDCTYMCANSIIGPNIICSSSTYTVPNGATFYNWSVSQSSNLVTLIGNGTPSVTITSLPNVSGAVTLSLTMGDDGAKCGNVTLTKTIWVGVPKFNNLQPIGNQNGYDPSEPNLSISPDGDGCNQIRLNAVFDSPNILEYQWEKLTTSVAWSVSPNSGYIYIYPQCNQNFSFKVRTRNICGWSEWKEFEYALNRCTIDCNTSIPIINTGLNFTLNPNPVTNDILNIHVKYNAPWFIIPVNIGNGSNFDITNEFGENNYQLIPNISVNITIFNQLGVPVLQFPNTSVHPTPAELDVSSLQAGTYMVVFEYQGQVESYTIIKN